MRLIWFLLTLAGGGYGLWWYTDSHPSLRSKVEEWMPVLSVRALEVRYTAEQVIESNQKLLSKGRGAKVVESHLKFYPHLLIEAKYTSKKTTKESLLLWDLTDGEMILDTEEWTKTHGFADCIQAHVLPYEFRVISVIARKGGVCDRKHLLEKLDIDFPVLEAWLRSCYKKNLVVEAGEKYRLHLQHPRLTRVPVTETHERLLTRSYRQAVRVPKHFSPVQIQRMAQMAFGSQFTIRKTTEVYLPVHCIVVQQGTGALQTYHFNALTGLPLKSALLYE